MPYRISLEVFEGPLDLLLHLIEEKEMEITAISLTLIIEQYLEYLKDLGELDLETAVSFLRITMDLIELKKRTLLPIEDQKIGEEKKEELVHILREYQTFRQAAAELQDLLEGQSHIYHRPDEVSLTKAPKAQLIISLKALKEALLTKRDKEEEGRGQRQIPFQLKETSTIKGQIQFIKEGISQGISNFYQLTKDLSLQDFVVTFLSLLELLRQGQVRVQQEGDKELIIYALP